MGQETIARDAAQPRNLGIRLWSVASAVADLLAIAGFLASQLKQDSLLILSTTVVGIVLASAIYRFRERIDRIRSLPVLLAYFAVSLVLVMVVWSILADSGVTPIEVDITDPQDGGSVTLRYLIKGTVSDHDARVYLIVHPLRVSEMWVQPLAAVGGEGNWQASATFGTEILGIGERYEVIALTTNDNFLVTWATGNALSEGQKLTSLPRKSNRSSLITVTRPK